MMATCNNMNKADVTSGCQFENGKHTIDVQVTSDDRQLVLGRYMMNTSASGILGEGSFSICRKGTNIQTGEEVAIKQYKMGKNNTEEVQGTLTKFRRQVAVLMELQKPWASEVSNDPAQWHEALMQETPGRLFMQMIDYSTDENGEPGPDARDGTMYMVTELAQYSLKEYLKVQRSRNQAFSRKAVKRSARAILLATAGLHAKGFVHLDLKPENMMMFNGRLKLIDVDGCVEIGSEVSLHDNSTSFSPCYCAPEWARFLLGSSGSTMTANPGLDSWSIGLTICELVTLGAVMRPIYGRFRQRAQSGNEASLLFMNWLGGLESEAPVPVSVEFFDAGLWELLHQGLLVCDADRRLSPVQCLSMPYFSSA